MHPSITVYLSLSFTLLYIITVLQGISYLTTEAERNHILHITHFFSLAQVREAADRLTD